MVRTPGCGPGDTSSSLVAGPTEGERERFAACLLNSAFCMGISFEYCAFRQRKQNGEQDMNEDIANILGLVIENMNENYQLPDPNLLVHYEN